MTAHRGILTRIMMAMAIDLSLMALCGCNIGGSDDSSNFTTQEGSVAHNTNPNVADTDLTTCVDGNTRFAIDMYGQLASESDNNLFFSPFSISLALSMAYGGARGITKDEMKTTMHFDTPEPGLYESFNALDLKISSPGASEVGTGRTPFELHLVNDIFGQIDLVFLDEYLNLLSEYYGANVKTLDFKNDPEGARSVINNYISDETRERIYDLVPEGVINADTRIVLTNAVYFNAGWATPFEESNTFSQPFTSLDGAQSNVPTMHQIEMMGHMTGDGFDAVSLAYNGGQVSMVLMLPEAGAFTEFENGLSAAFLQTVFDGLEEKDVDLSLPSFEFDYGLSLTENLMALGMEAPFDMNTADFSGMNGVGELYIKDVVHKAFVKVDEEGTEAAAATAVILDTLSGEFGMEAPVVVRFDRPFFFVIRDNLTNTILFAGRIVKL